MNSKIPKEITKFFNNYAKFCSSQKWMLEYDNNKIKVVPYNKTAMVKFLKNLKVEKQKDETYEKS